MASQHPSRPVGDILRVVRDKASALFVWRLPHPNRPMQSVQNQFGSVGNLLQIVLSGESACVSPPMPPPLRCAHLAW